MLFSSAACMLIRWPRALRTFAHLFVCWRALRKITTKRLLPFAPRVAIARLLRSLIECATQVRRRAHASSTGSATPRTSFSRELDVTRSALVVERIAVVFGHTRSALSCTSDPAKNAAGRHA